jgi:hypothetical protein
MLAPTLLEWVFNHLPHVGWTAIILAVGRGVWWLRGVKEKANEVYVQTTNHMPHELAAQTKLLINIDKNMALLAHGKEAILDSDDSHTLSGN